MDIKKVSQHYVPQSYLKRFGTQESRGKKVFVFNKEYRKIEKDKSIKNIACQDYFYDSEYDDLISGRHKIQGMENTLSDLETYTSKLLVDIEAGLSRGIGLSSQQQLQISYVLFVQFVRTRKFKEEHFKPVTDQVSTNGHIALGISQPKIFEKPLGMFSSKKYILCESVRGIDFVTSDHPIAFVPNVDVRSEDHISTKQLLEKFVLDKEPSEIKGMDIIFPISPKRAIIGIDESTRLIVQGNQTFLRLNYKQSVNIIGAQALSAQRIVIGSTKEAVKFAKELLEFKEQELSQRSAEETNRIQALLNRF